MNSPTTPPPTPPPIKAKPIQAKQKSVDKKNEITRFQLQTLEAIDSRKVILN